MERELPGEAVYNPLLITATSPEIMTDACCLMRCEGGEKGGETGEDWHGRSAGKKVRGMVVREGENVNACVCERIKGLEVNLKGRLNEREKEDRQEGEGSREGKELREERKEGVQSEKRGKVRSKRKMCSKRRGQEGEEITKKRENKKGRWSRREKQQ